MFKIFFAAAVASAVLAAPVSAATLNGIFNVTAVNALERTTNQSRATEANVDATYNAMVDGKYVNARDKFTYTGDLDFGTYDSKDGTTILGWLMSGGGIIDGLDASFGALQLSKPSISKGTATTTFFVFTTMFNAAGDFIVKHDDGMAIFDDGVRIGGRQGPNALKTTTVKAFDGGEFSLLYVATNGDPSVLYVDANLAPIPLPASLPLLLAGLGGLAIARRKRT